LGSSRCARFPTSWQLAAPDTEFTARMFEAINSMMLDMPPGREWR
jgi:hypothetical protein